MKFTIEQLEKIISEAPEGAEFWYSGVYADIHHKIIGSQHSYLPSNRFSLTDLAEQLQEMKMKAEIDNTAQQVESLSALEMSERDIENAINESCPYAELRSIGNRLHNALCSIHDNDDIVSEFDVVVSKLWDCKAPLTPKQKQAQIDERNGELFYSLVRGVSSHMPNWMGLNPAESRGYINIAKKVEFNGKLGA